MQHPTYVGQTFGLSDECTATNSPKLEVRFEVIMAMKIQTAVFWDSEDRYFNLHNLKIG
jgi:hypothetical protein